MPNFGSPIAQDVNPTGQGLQTLGGMLGVMQQGLGLQQSRANIGIAQAQELSAQAGAQQEQQKNQELQQAQSLAASAVNGGAFRNKDGSLNANQLSARITNLGPYAAQFGNAIIARANEGIQNKTAINKLNTQEQSQVADTLLSVANRPGVSYSDVVNAMSEMGSNNPQLSRLALSAMGMFHPDETSQQLSVGLKQLATSMHGGGTAPTLSQMQGPNGVQLFQTNPNAAMPLGPVGAQMPQGLTPQKVISPLTGSPGFLHPNGVVTPIGTAPQDSIPKNVGPYKLPSWLSSTRGGYQLQAGEGALLSKDVDALSTRITNSISAANSSPQALDSLTRIGAILDQGTMTGGAFATFKTDVLNNLAGLGADTSSSDNLSELGKNMARFEATRASAAGNTDAARQLVAEGSPNFHMDAKAVKAVVNQSIANEEIIQSYANLMSSTIDPQVALQREAALRSIPHLLQMLEAGNLKSPEEFDAFTKHYDITPSEIVKSRKMYDKLMQGVPPISKGGG